MDPETSSPGRPRPDRLAVLVGAVKSGTMSFYEYLTTHPEICASKRRELHFFDRNENWEGGFETYAEGWDWDPDRHTWAFEKTPSYTQRPTEPNAADRMRRLADEYDLDVKILYLVRHPLDQIESQATHEQARDNLEGPADRLRMEWLEAGMYAKQLEAYETRFPREDIMVMNLEDLKEDPRTLLRDVCRFLGIDDDHDFPGVDEVHHRSQDLPTKHPLLSAAETLGLAQLAGRAIPDGLRRRLNDALRGEQGEKVELPEEERAFALHALEADLRALRRRHDIDVSRWGIDLDGAPVGEVSQGRDPGAPGDLDGPSK